MRRLLARQRVVQQDARDSMASEIRRAHLVGAQASAGPPVLARRVPLCWLPEPPVPPELPPPVPPPPEPAETPPPGPRPSEPPPPNRPQRRRPTHHRPTRPTRHRKPGTPCTPHAHTHTLSEAVAWPSLTAPAAVRCALQAVRPATGGHQTPCMRMARTPTSASSRSR